MTALIKAAEETSLLQDIITITLLAKRKTKRNKNGTSNVRTFYFERVIFGHFLSPFGQISEKNFGHCAETWLK